MISHMNLRQKFIQFYSDRGHVKIENASLILQNDPTTLFTSSGMQPLVPYLLGEKHPQGNRLVDIQPCIRTVDIDDVGDNRHLTFFEMIGNWSLGDYFKEDQLEWCWQFFTNEIGLNPAKLYVTVFEGGYGIEHDNESEKIWKKLGFPQERISKYGADKNWWSRAGAPDMMPIGEIGGPSSEIFYDFGTPHNTSYGKTCHPNCECGRFMEIGNSVFIQYKKEKDGSLSELKQKNVDFGGGLERILAAVQDDSDVYKTDIFSDIISVIENEIGKKYSDVENTTNIRIIADHLKATCFLISQGVTPSNKGHGYVIRRLIRRSIVKMTDVGLDIQKSLPKIISSIKQIYNNNEFGEFTDTDLLNEIGKEADAFERVMHQAYNLLQKLEPTAVNIYNLEQSNGLPVPLALERLDNLGISYKKDILSEIEKLRAIHSQQSRSSSTGMFRGGLADHSEQVVKYHTATHLIHKALREVLGHDVRQEGSNITGERLRFDFQSGKRPSDEEIIKIEKIVNKKIAEKLPVYKLELSKEQANTLDASSFFKEKYGDIVTVYFIGGDKDHPESAYSKEYCGGPHIQNTGDIGTIKIDSIKKIGASILRLYAS